MLKKTLCLLVPILLASALLARPKPLEGVKRILFLGNSITWAGSYVNDVDAWLCANLPQQHFVIINAGLPSETVSGLSEEGHAGGAFARPDLHERLERVLAITKPDLVFACYGMNDGIYLPLDEDRFRKFKEGITWLHECVIKTGAAIIHITPPVYDEVKGNAKGYGLVLDKYSEWLLSMKRHSGWQVADIHFPMKQYLKAHRRLDKKFGVDGFCLANDGVHPGETGHWIMAKQVLLQLGFEKVKHDGSILMALKPMLHAAEFVKLVTTRNNMMRDAWLSASGHKRPGMPTGLPLDEALARYEEQSVAISSLALGLKWMGFRRTDFVIAGRRCLLVEPDTVSAEHFWIWRTEFFGHEPQADSVLLTKGFHVAYMNLENMYGSPASMQLMDSLYQFLVNEKGLNKKPVLEGFSRGGLFAFNWAAHRPEAVSALYVDAPVCDFKSWPGGRGKSKGSPEDWKLLKQVYHFSSDDEAYGYTQNPIDNLAPLATASIPILCVCGQTDDVVPMDENIIIVEQRYRLMGGNIEVIAKPNNGHHPHSLKDPAPIVEFVLRSVR